MYTLNTNYYPYFQYKKATKKSKGTIFFIHGYAVNSSYHNCFSDLIDDYDYYAVELPGHGITPLKNKNQLKPQNYAIEVAKLISDLKLENIILMGHSMGGGIAVMVSQLIPQQIKKMIIVTPMNSRGTTKITNFLFHFNPKTPKACEKFYKILLFDYEKEKHLITPEIIDEEISLQTKYAKNFKILKHRMASINNMLNLAKAEKNIPVKTLLFVGKGDDCINPNTTLKNFKKKNMNINSFMFEHSGHLPFFEENKLYFLRVMDFINE